MAFSAEIVARLGLNTDGFSRGIQAVPVQVDRAAVDAVKTLKKRFGSGDIFRGLLQGIGIGSVQQIADKIIEPFRKAAESAKEIAQLTAEANAADKALAESRLKNEQRYQLAIKERDKLERDLASNRGRTDEEIKQALETRIQLIKQENQVRQIAADIEKEAAAAAKERAEEQRKISEWVRRANDELAQEQRRRAEEAARAEKEVFEIKEAYIRENLELLTLEAKAKRGLNAEDAERLKVLREQVKQQERQQNIVELLKNDNRNPAEEALLQKLIYQSAEYEKQLGLNKQILQTTEARAKVEEGMRIGFSQTGRRTEELSDQELLKKRQNLQQQLLETQLLDQSPNGLNLFGASLITSQDVLKGFKERELAGVIAEQDLRNRTRQNVEAFGTQRAFEMFAGTLAQFNQYIREAGDIPKQERFLSAIEKLERNVQRIPEAIKAATEN